MDVRKGNGVYEGGRMDVREWEMVVMVIGGVDVGVRGDLFI